MLQQKQNRIQQENKFIANILLYSISYGDRIYAVMLQPRKYS